MTKSENQNWEELAHDFLDRFRSQDLKINTSDLKYLAQDFAKETDIEIDQAEKYIQKALNDNSPLAGEQNVSQDESDKESIIKVHLVRCNKCNSLQEYRPLKAQFRKRKYCIHCKKKFTINAKSILQSVDIKPTPTPSSDSNKNGHYQPGPDQKSKLSFSLLTVLINIIKNHEGESEEKENLINLLKEYASQKSQKGSFSEVTNARGGVVGGGQGTDHFSKNPSSRKPSTSDFNPNKDVSSEPRGGMTISKNADHFSEPDHFADHFHRQEKSGPTVVREPLEDYLQKLQEQFANRQDYDLKDYEDLAVKRFGLPSRIANRLRKKMRKPSRRDPAQQYRLDIPEQFTLILSRKNICLFYPKQPNASRELFDFAKDVITPHEFKSFCFCYGEHEVLDKVEIKAPRIQGLRKIDPLYWKFNVELKDGKCDFVKYTVSHDHSQNEDNIEFRGLTKLGQEYFAQMTQTQFEFSLGNMNRRLNQSILNSQLDTHDYLQNNLSGLQTTVLEVKDLNYETQRDLNNTLKQLRRDETIQKQQLSAQLDLVSIETENGKKIDDLTIEFSKFRQSSIFPTNQTIPPVKVTHTSTAQQLLSLIRSHPGITRSNLDKKLGKYHGYANRIVSYYKSKNIIREEKDGRRAGRLFIHAPHNNFSSEEKSNV